MIMGREGDWECRLMVDHSPDLTRMYEALSSTTKRERDKIHKSSMKTTVSYFKFDQKYHMNKIVSFIFLLKPPHH